MVRQPDRDRLRPAVRAVRRAVPATRSRSSSTAPASSSRRSRTAAASMWSRSPGSPTTPVPATTTRRRRPCRTTRAHGHDDGGRRSVTESTSRVRPCYGEPTGPPTASPASSTAGTSTPTDVPWWLQHPECGVTEIYWDGEYYGLPDDEFVALVAEAAPCYQAFVDGGDMSESTCCRRSSPTPSASREEPLAAPPTRCSTPSSTARSADRARAGRPGRSLSPREAPARCCCSPSACGVGDPRRRRRAAAAHRQPGGAAPSPRRRRRSASAT